MSELTHCANCGAEVPSDKPHRVGECDPPTTPQTKASAPTVGKDNEGGTIGKGRP